MKATDLEVIGTDIQAQWVLDKIWVTYSVMFNDGRTVEQGPVVLDWPIKPVKRVDWLDVWYAVVEEVHKLRLPV